MTNKSELIDELRNAIAHNKLFVITGAGVSTKVTKKDGSKLPSWGELIQNIRKRAEEEKVVFTDKEKEMLDRLIPNDLVNDVHGDAYIEASQIIENKIHKKDRFSQWVQEETSGRPGYYGEYHKYIEKIKPRGIATFNYDQCHENAFAAVKSPYEAVLYNEDDKLVSHLNNGFNGSTIILKAHGCISKSESIVLTSNSYKKLLKDSRAYRATIQHILSRFTILIIGFSLRDRDFDQMLSTIEQEFGTSVQSHIVIMKKDEMSAEPDKEKERKLNISNYAVLESRYGLKVLPTETHTESEEIIKDLYLSPGSWINRLSREIVSSDKAVRSKSRREISELSEIGRQQLSDLLTEHIANGSGDLIERSEQLYLLGTLRVNNQKVLGIFLKEIENQTKAAIGSSDNSGNIECVAHSLVALRYFSTTDTDVISDIEQRLVGISMIDKLVKLDKMLQISGKNPRLVNYARATFSEIVARSAEISA